MRRFLVALAALTFTHEARAVRPFVTDDARVVGKGRVQLESWWRRDFESVEKAGSLQHWAVAAIGPNDRMELSLGLVHGVGEPEKDQHYSLAGPLLQGKFLVHEAKPNSWPGLAAVFGAVPPFGTGAFTAPAWTLFSYLCITQVLFNDGRVSVHGNLGFAGTSETASRFTWGFGTEIGVLGAFHLIGEIYSGDPYIAGVSGTAQFGVRFAFNDHLQLDATGGLGLFAANQADIAPPFVGSGLRLVSHPWF